MLTRVRSCARRVRVRGRWSMELRSRPRFAYRSRIAALALMHRIPSFATSPDFVGEGGLLAYGASRRRLFIRSAYYVKGILEGARASDLPVEQPTRVELWINVRTAKALKLVVPTTLLAQADQIIE